MTDFHKYLETLLKGQFADAEQTFAMERSDFTFPEAENQWQPPRHFLIENLKMTWKVAFETSTITAKNELSIISKIANLKVVKLHAADIDILEIKDQNKNKLFFEHDPENQTLFVTLNEEVCEGGNVTLTFNYKIVEPQVAGYFIKPNSYFPKVGEQFWTHLQDDYARYLIPIYDHPSYKFPVEMIVTVPEGFYAISNGELLSQKKNKNKTETFHWKQEKPVPAYLITLAIGKYVIHKEKAGDLDVYYYAEKKHDKETVYRTFGKTPKMIAFLEEKLAVKYPWKKYGQVCVSNFIIGGMENTSVTSMTDVIMHDEKTHKDLTFEGLVAHELVHQWIGDLITCKSWSHGWINEGGATQLQNEWKKFDLGVDEYLYEQYGKQESYFNEDKNKYRRPIVQTKWVYGMDVFDAHLYPGAAWRYYMLKHLVGEEIWWQVLSYILTQHAYTSIETVDFQRAFEVITGNDYDWFFDQWLYKAGYPEVKIKCSYNSEDKQVIVKIEQTQDVEETPKVFRFPFTIQIIDQNGTKKQYSNEITERIHFFYLPVDLKPAAIELDPDYAVLMDVQIEKPIEMWIHQLKNGSNVIMKIRAAKALGKKATIKAVDALSKAILAEEFWGVQAEIATILGNLKTQLALFGLLNAVKINDSRARSKVAAALGNFYKEENALNSLVEMLDDRDSYFVEAAAATSIGKIKHKNSLKILTDLLPKIKSSWAEIVLRGYLSGIAATEKKEAIEILLPYFEVGKSDYCRREVIVHLAKVGKLCKKEHPEIKEILEKTLLNDKSHRVIGSTISAISSYGDASLISSLNQFEKMSYLHHFKRAAKGAVRALGKIKDTSELKSIEKTVEELQIENRKIKERLDKLENDLSKGK